MGKAGTKSPTQKTKPKLKLTDKEQSERFIEAARKVGDEATSEQFEKVFKKMVPPKLPGGKPDS
jgi:hypothetical protein